MWQFSGLIGFVCNSCSYISEKPISEFEIDCYGGDERSMGTEFLYDLKYDTKCEQCGQEILLQFDVSEYPVGAFNFAIDKSSGAATTSSPEFEYLEELYFYDDSQLEELEKPLHELMTYLKQNPNQLHHISPRKFEEVVAEIFKNKGFIVSLTKRTRDGGKDIIAIHKDSLGIESKYFIECKRHSKNNKVGVDIVRALYGVKNTKDGPNKTILVTTSSFTNSARKYVESEANSKWDLSLVDYNQIVTWLGNYGTN